MNELIRTIGWKAGKRLGSQSMMDRCASRYYRYAREHIPCACARCKCPAGEARRYSFVYLDESRKWMYFDVPKAASTTIRKAFFGNKASASLKNPRRSLDQYLKFTFVRNPWDRMVSNWKMFTTQPARIEQLRSMTDADVSEFADFIDFAMRQPNHHWQPQVLFTPEKLDFIGRLEDFDRDMNRLREMMGKQPLELEKRNTTKRKRYQEYYTPGLVEKVAGFYAEDIEAFGFDY